MSFGSLLWIYLSRRRGYDARYGWCLRVDILLSGGNDGQDGAGPGDFILHHPQIAPLENDIDNISRII